jgi:transposase
VQDFAPPKHIGALVRETVREGSDLRAILSDYDEERGYPHCHPGMMTALLLYAGERD